MTETLIEHEYAEPACRQVLRIARDAGESWTDEFLAAQAAWKVFDESWEPDDVGPMWDAAFVLAGELGLGLHVIDSGSTTRYCVRLADEEAA